MKNRSNERGAALMFTFAVLLSMTLLVGAFVFMVSTRILGSGGSWTAAQAVWIAEGGLQQVYYQLYTDSSFRNSPTSPVTGALGTGSYSVTVSKSGQTYTLGSTGTVSGFSRKINRTVTVSGGYPYAFDYGVFGNTNASQLRLMNNVTITGDLFYDGNVQIDSGNTVTGLVYADAVTGSGSYTVAGGSPSPVPTYPSFSTASYDSAITTAEGTATSNWTLSGSSSYNLNGGTVYYKAVTIKNSAAITGTGTIVATGDVLIRDSANIGPDITIITKKDLTVQNTSVVQSGGVLYGRNSVTLRDNAGVTGSVLVPTSGKTASVVEDATLTGILYADIVKLRDQAVVTGSVAGNDFTNDRITDTVHVTFSASARPTTLPPGFTATPVSVTPQNDWDEVVTP